MSLAMKARQKVKKKTVKDKIFGCDLLEHLQLSGQEVPQVLKSCAEFVEEHGIVDGIYRLCGIASNVQKLRQEFDIEKPPDLNKSTYLQDVHCVSSLCKAYFRELPNPLLTYQLYDKFADAVAIQLEEQRLVKIREVLKELPLPHYRTLEYLIRHLLRMASYSAQTNMHTRNLAIVWAPNLLRSKDIESSGFHSTAAFMEVRVQSIVVEFILTHVEQLFGDGTNHGKDNEGPGVSMNWPTCVPEDYFRSLSYNLPNMLNHGDGPPQMRPYHTIIEFSDHKRKGSLKAKKWKSIFNLGRSNQDSKRKSHKPEDKDVKSGKMSLRPAKSMDSLSSVPDVAHASDVEQNSLSLRSPRNQLSLRRESLGSPSKENEFIFLDPEEHPHSMDTHDAEYREEGQAKSEPTTPKLERSPITGNPTGRSPKSTQNRAEKCVGVHISGPFSVTLPFHITSNLSRLTRGMECPGLSVMAPQGSTKKFSLAEALPAESNDTCQQRPSRVMEQENQSHQGAEVTATEEPGTDTARISLEVQDTFSFLDTQDTSIEKTPENTLDSEMLVYDLHTENKMQEFSVEPPVDDLCTEDEAGQMYFIPSGFVDEAGHWREMHESLEDVYLSAHDDLSPISQVPEMNLENEEPSSEEQQCILHETLHTDSDPIKGTIEEDHLRSDASNHQEHFLTDAETQCNEIDCIEVDNHLSQQSNTEDWENKEHVVCTEGSDAPATDDVDRDKIIDDPGSREGKTVDPPNSDIRSVPPSPEEVQHGGLYVEDEVETVQSREIEERIVSDLHKKAGNTTECGEEQLHTCHRQDEDLLEAPDLSQQPMTFAQDINILLSDAALENDDCETGEDPNAEMSDSHNSGHAADHTVHCPFRRESSSETIPSPVQVQNSCTDGRSVEDLRFIIDNQCCSHDDSLCLTISSEEATGDDLLCDQRTLEEKIRDSQAQEETDHVNSKEDNETYQIRPSLHQISQPAAEPDIHPDRSVSMKMMATANKILQVKSVPVVPPKPQFAKLHPALKSKIHGSPLLSANKDSKSPKPEKSSHMKPPETSDAAPERRSSWRNATSISFDTAMALAKERQSQNQVRRMQTYCIGDSYEIMDTSKLNITPHAPRFTVKSASSRTHRPHSCMSCGEGELQGSSIVGRETVHGLHAVYSQEPDSYTKEVPQSKRLSMPRLGQPSAINDHSKCHQQRRSLL